MNGEPPLTNKVWAERRNIEIEVLSDPSLNFVNMMVGSRNINESSLKTIGGMHVPGDRILLPNPGVVLLDRHGVLKSKLFLPNLNQVTASVRDIEEIIQETGDRRTISNSNYDYST